MTAPANSAAPKNNSWRVIDIVTAAVLGVACGLLFWVWNSLGNAGFKALDALTPGLGGLVTGIWFTGGVLGGLALLGLIAVAVGPLVNDFFTNFWKNAGVIR